ncbi:MAG: ribosome-associated translation inhibitor RaiA [Planctomycetota bacterium]|jgi:ribosomal subunit interface protein|nr:ribosome-associated translation inhibitor RaiA [Planctomycetota bacterium]
MNIQITARKIEILPGIRESIREKLSRLDKFNHKIQNLESVIKAEERSVSCELIIHIDNQESLVIEASGDTIQAAADIAIGKAERQLRKGKERESVRRRANLPDE